MRSEVRKSDVNTPHLSIGGELKTVGENEEGDVDGMFHEVVARSVHGHVITLLQQ